MALIKWRDSYSVGSNEIDDEHKSLVKLVNDIFILVRDKKPQQAITSTLNELTAYAQIHFSSEEKLLAEVNYPGLEEHKIIHQDLLEKVSKYTDRLENNDEEILQDFYLFLRDWLMTHIMEEDMQFKPYFEDH